MMDSKNEMQLIEASKKGDNKSFSELCKMHTGFIVETAEKLLAQYKISNIDINDLVAAGNLGILAALKNYDAEKGYTFLTYAGIYIEKEIRSEIVLQTGITAGQEIQFTSLDIEIDSEEGIIPKFAHLEDKNTKSPDSFMEEVVNHPKAMEILEKQSRIIRRIIDLYYGLGEFSTDPHTMKEIADELKISVKKVKSAKEDIEFQMKQAVFFGHLAY